MAALVDVRVFRIVAVSSQAPAARGRFWWVFMLDISNAENREAGWMPVETSMRKGKASRMVSVLESMNFKLLAAMWEELRANRPEGSGRGFPNDPVTNLPAGFSE